MGKSLVRALDERRNHAGAEKNGRCHDVGESARPDIQLATDSAKRGTCWLLVVGFCRREPALRPSLEAFYFSDTVQESSLLSLSVCAAFRGSIP